MLNQLRNASRTWIAGAFIALLVASFAIWGVSDIFVRSSHDAVVLVGKDRISVARFSNAFDREINRISEQAGSDFDRQTAVSLGVDDAIVTRLAMQSAIAQRTSELGLTATENAIAAQLREVDAFIDPITERFDRATYLSLLAQNNITPQQYEADVAHDIVSNQLVAVLTAGLRPPDALAEPRLRFNGEKRALSIVVVPPDAVGEPPEPSEDEIAAFYDENQALYASPPRRAVSIVTMSVDDFMPDVPVSEEDLQEAYELRRDTMSTPERRDILELAAADEDVAADAARRLRAGEDPDEIAETLDMPAPAHYEDALKTDILTTAAADAAFALDVGEVSDAIDGGISWFVMRVDEITPGSTPSFEEARPELRDELAATGASDMLFDAIDAFELARDEAATLERAAEAARVPVFSYGPLDANGLDDRGVRPSQLAAHPEIIRAAFDQPVAGVMSELTELGEEGFFVVRVDEMIDSATRPLTEVEDDVRARLVATARGQAFNDIAQAARDALAGGASAAAAAQAASDAAQPEITELTRTDTTATMTAQIVAAAFSAPQGEVFAAPTPDGGFLVGRVDSITQADAPDADALASARARLAIDVTNDIGQLFQAGLQKAYPVRVDQSLLARATGVDQDQ